MMRTRSRAARETPFRLTDMHDDILELCMPDSLDAIVAAAATCRALRRACAATESRIELPAAVVKWDFLQRLASKGNASAMYRLGMACVYCLNDRERGTKLLQQARDAKRKIHTGNPAALKGWHASLVCGAEPAHALHS